MKKATLYYVYDPMCSWCWGFRPTWLELQEKLAPLVDIQYRIGGLAPDCDQPMTEEMQEFLRQTWHKIAQQLGTQFNFDFWRLCQPRRSTYPACRALLLAREQGKEQAMNEAIQRAYYLKANNPANTDTLVGLASEIGLEPVLFESRLHSEALQQQLIVEIADARALPIQGFPSLVLQTGSELIAIPIDYLDGEATYQMIIDSLEA